MDTLIVKNGFPIYYGDFSCIADKCKNSCCIGWEIDIDEDTKELYESLEGSYAEKIKESIINDEDGAHFKLCGNGNCPHLNEKGLCEIITEYGDGALSDICYLHPRFINSFSGYEETGLGLSCEEVARIIITSDEPFHIIAQSGFDSNLTDEEKDMIEIREDIFTAVNYQGLKLSERISYICNEFGINLKKIKVSKLHYKFLSLERLCDEWTKLLENAVNAESSLSLLDSEDLTDAFKNILAYFIFRHYPKTLQGVRDTDVIKFSVCSVLLLSLLMNVHENETKEEKTANLINYARMLSSEVEYSEENTYKLFEIL